MKAGPRNGSRARSPRVRPSIDARAALWTAAVRGDAAPGLSNAVLLLPRLRAGERLDTDLAGQLLTDDTLRAADSDGELASGQLAGAQLAVARLATIALLAVLRASLRCHADPVAENLLLRHLLLVL